MNALRNFIFAFLFLARAVCGAEDFLQNYIGEAIRSNPALQAAQKTYEADAARIAGLGNLEAPALNAGYYPEPIELMHGKQVAQFSIMQMFNWPGTQKALQTEAAAMAKMQSMKAISLRNEIVMKVKSQWNNLAALKKIIDYKKQILEIQKQMEDLAIADFKVSGYSSALEAGMQTLELEIEIETMQSDMRMSIADFNALLGRSASDEVLLSDTLFLAEADTARPDMNPMLAMLHAESEAYKSQKAMFRKMGYPMLGLGLQYMLVKESDNMVMLMGQVTLPVWRGKTNSAISEAMLRSDAAQMSMAGARSELEARKEQARRRIELAGKKLALYKRQASLTDSKHKMALQDLSAGKARFPDILQIRIELISYNIKEIEAVAEYNSAVADLEAAF